MNLFTPEQLATFSSRHFAFLEVEEKAQVLYVCLNRPKRKNALHPQMLNEIAYCMQYAYAQPSVWAVLIEAKGNVFCAGADLKALAGMVEPHDSDIPAPQQEVLIGELFNKVHKPLVAKVTGDVYAGGFFFLAGSHIVLAQQGIRLGLPEVKRGLFPFQVMAALLRVMPPRKVIDWCIRGYDLPVEEAARYGLVSQVAAAGEIDGLATDILGELLQNSPTAIRMGLEAFDHIRPAEAEHQYLHQMLMKTLATADGQEGLRAFREKRPPRWTGQ